MALTLSGTSGITGAGIGTIGPSGANVTGIVTATDVKVGSGITLSADGDIFATGVCTATSLVGGSARFTDDGSASPTVSIQTDDANPYALNIGNSSYNTSTSYGLNLYNNNSCEGYFRHVGNSAYLDYHFSLHNNSSNKICLKFEADDQSVELYAAGSKKFETTETGTVTTGISTATHFNPTEQPYGTKNLIINGSMQVAQRATSSTTSGYGSLDRWNVTMGHTDEAFTHSQIELSSSDTGPWAAGFRYSFHIQNGNQTGGAGADDRVSLYYIPEAQDLANSGWDYTSASSYITLSFWVKSSVAQNFYFYLRTDDSTKYNYVMETGSLSANTWTKITKTIPGNSNLQIDDDNGAGFQVWPVAFYGTNYTNDSITENAWAAWASGNRSTDQTSTWWTTNDSTFEVTGVQLELGSVVTPFEHRIFGDELARCKRYYQQFPQNPADAYGPIAVGRIRSSTNAHIVITFPEMRSSPTAAKSGNLRVLHAATGTSVNSVASSHMARSTVFLEPIVSSGLAQGEGCILTADNDSSGKITLSAEL